MLVMMTCNSSHGDVILINLIYGREIKGSNKQENIQLFLRKSITRHLNERISLFFLISLRPGCMLVYFNTQIQLIIIFLMCVYCARKTGHQSSSSLLSMLRADGSLLFAAIYLYTVRMPMSVHNYWFSIRQVHHRVSVSLEKTRSSLSLSLFLSVAHVLSLVRFFSRETCLRMKSVSYAPIFILTLSIN